MARTIPRITEAELKVMKIFWRFGSGTVRDVLDRLAEAGEEKSAYTTIMTLMNQLAAKGALLVDRSRQPFVYRPALKRERVLTDRLHQFLQTVFDGQVSELVLYLADRGDLSPEDFRRLEDLIQQREEQSRRPGEDASDTTSTEAREGRP